MKLIHLGDLHIGKRVNEFSMLEDQEFILARILSVIEDEQPDGVLLAGDIYDKTVPSAEAVALFDRFLVRLARLGPAVFMISGNHDSPERIAFGGRLMEQSRVYVSPIFDGHIKSVLLKEGTRQARIYLLPFVKPVQVRHYLDESVTDYNQAMEACIREMKVNPEEINILVAHQFVTGAIRCESEELFIASLSLALGLSEEIQHTASGIRLDTMFVDEGFGSLDEDTLQQAMRALQGLTEGNRLVGIISHVSELRRAIDRQIVVTKEKSGGSRVEIIT